jgi:hypothetical protein
MDNNNDFTITEVAGFDAEGQPVMGETTVIKKEDMVQLNDPNCEHQWEPDPTEDTDFYFGIKCKLCPVGKLIKREN